MKKIKIAKYGIYEYAVYNIYKILSYENLIYLKEYYEKEKRKKQKFKIFSSLLWKLYANRKKYGFKRIYIRNINTRIKK